MTSPAPATLEGKDMTVKLTPYRTDVECKRCGTGYAGPNNEFGTIMAGEFIKQHKCPKPPKEKKR